MKTKYLYKTIFALVLTVLVNSCGYNEDLVEELDFKREFAPVGLKATVRNQTYVELDWTIEEEVSDYIVEFSADDPDFNTIFLSQEVNSSELPVTIRLEGETVYSIRVQALSSRDLDDSKWAFGEATTLSEQIMEPYQPGDAQATSATLRWEPGSNVTTLNFNDGAVIHNITADEKAAGVATVTGLTSETEYSVILFNNTKNRGQATITTTIAVGNNTLLSPTDDIVSAINNAMPGDIILFNEGDYTAQSAEVDLTKSITLRGLHPDFKPQLKLAFSVLAGATDVSLIDLVLMGEGNGQTINQDVVRYNEADNYNSLTITGCVISDYNKSFIAGSTTDAIIQSVVVDNCIVTDIWTNGGDFIDFRNSNVFNISVTNTTFNNCAPEREFFRIDDAGSQTQNGKNCNIILKNCTLNACSNKSSERLMYVRFQTNTITSQYNLITNTECRGYSDQSRTDQNPTFGGNNYYNADGFYDVNERVHDTSGFTENPGFVDPLNGDFTVTNQLIIDNNIGDPRWL
ncbi:DUF4957 domain-containing protein [Tamlana sp. s12]|uniref:DUF5123 domain-containing protein n=1 Tax=Tamlana sp. s12 TaxID=1630406 RepID=UPI00192B2A37|nr:DUF4957 domain-containing protein [Tamlana sp. s12]QQY82328.1 DUF4957 domain-containing protein [Tamlana sp. s12]